VVEFGFGDEFSVGRFGEERRFSWLSTAIEAMAAALEQPGFNGAGWGAGIWAKNHLGG